MLSAVLWVPSARSLGPLPSQQHQTKRGLVAVRSLNSKLTSFLFLIFQKLLHLLVTKHRDLPGPVLAANTEERQQRGELGYETWEAKVEKRKRITETIEEMGWGERKLKSKGRACSNQGGKAQ